MILDDIVEKRKEQLIREKKIKSLDEVKEEALLKADKAPRFLKALSGKRLSVISEVKKASPSKGVIKEDFDPVDIALKYEKAGADAISVLTEEHYFKGSPGYLKAVSERVKIPVLRKDFITDEYQIYESKVFGASAVLLIMAVLGKDKLLKLKNLSESIGLDCLVEVHDENELYDALLCNAGIIGINNRNLKTFKTDINTTKKLMASIPSGVTTVSESGIKANADMKMLKACNVNAVLIGETLMRSGDIEKTLHELRAGV